MHRWIFCYRLCDYQLLDKYSASLSYFKIIYLALCCQIIIIIIWFFGRANKLFPDQEIISLRWWILECHYKTRLLLHVARKLSAEVRTSRLVTTVVRSETRTLEFSFSKFPHFWWNPKFHGASPISHQRTLPSASLTEFTLSGPPVPWPAAWYKIIIIWIINCRSVLSRHALNRFCCLASRDLR
jgi:hypothetical protein